MEPRTGRLNCIAEASRCRTQAASSATRQRHAALQALVSGTHRPRVVESPTAPEG